MTERRPIVLVGGRYCELPRGDTVAGQDSPQTVIPATFGELPLELPDDLRFQLLLTGLYAP